eukprot:432849-Amphidinium_carterae.1
MPVTLVLVTPVQVIVHCVLLAQVPTSQRVVKVVDGVISLSAAFSVALSQKVCDRSHNDKESEKGQIEPKGKSAREVNMVAEQVTFRGLCRAGINAVRLNVKGLLPQKFKGNRARLTGILRQLQITRQPITDANVISGYTLEAESE